MKSTYQIAAMASITVDAVALRAKRLGLRPCSYTSRGMAMWPESVVARIVRKPKRGRPKRAKEQPK